ncbi:CapA family protein [Methylocapsa sp. S129]|uniref:CapA family protein n=1 Tax=Methylocapsa sp. S129 TaxID=1641869 RepID=UPI00131D2EDD|nr:CapA family protein [Methylocapsa sp. S129]
MQPMILALSGDILPTRRLTAPARAVEDVYDLIRTADLAIGNFEMPLTDGGAPVQKLLNIRAAPEIAADVPALGFGVLTLANNHAVDYGWTGLEDTLWLLREQKITVVGAGWNEAEAAAPATLDVQGRRIAIIAFSCLTPTGMSAAPDRPGIAALHVETAYEIDPWYQMEEPGDPSVVKIKTRIRDLDLAKATRLVAEARAACDFLVVTIHWGFGSGEELAEYQLPLGQALIDAGADVVHGHHPHAVHAIGFHRGKPIFFGPGTFIGQQVFLDAPPNVKALWAGMSPDGYVARLSLASGADPTIALHPTTLDADRLPRLAHGDDFDRIAERLKRLSAPYGAVISSDGGVLHAAPIPGCPRQSHGPCIGSCRRSST